MLKTKPYKVSTIPNKNKLGGVINKFSRLRRKRQLVASIIGIYLLIGGVIGFVVFNSSGSQAKADQSAFISSSLKIIEEKDYKLGDEISVGITLQNTSVSESINSIFLDMYSTKDSLKWTTATNDNNPSEKIVVSSTNSFKLGILSAGERSQYTLKANLEDNQIDYLNILGKLRYLNNDGSQDIDTNRAFVKLSGNKNLSETLSLKSNKESFDQSEEINLSLERVNEQKYKGKIYVTSRNSQDLVNSWDCVLDDTNLCEAKLKNLATGDYSALFIDENENTFSNIFWFKVSGKKTELLVNSQASLEFPFESTSLNGLVPVVAKRVLSLNQNPDSNSFCNFEISAGGKVSSTLKVLVESDRTCKTTLNSDQFKSGDGIYKVKLLGSNLEKEISYLSKNSSLLNLEKKTAVLEKGKSVDIEAKNIVDSLAQPLNDKKVTLSLWQVNSGSFSQQTTLNGNILKVNTGIFAATIPASLLSEGGFYMVSIKVEDGQQSDWLSLSFEDKEIGFSGSGVLVDNSKLRIGENINFSLENLVDRSGNQILDGQCSANVYSTGSGAVATSISGQIKKGTCSALLSAGKVTRSGPTLVSFTGSGINNPINQCRQFNLAPGKAEKYGKLSLEFQPALAGYANNLMIGPVTDKFGNPVNLFDTKVSVENNDGVLQELSNINIEEGFAKVAIPSSLFQSEELSFKFKNNKNEEFLSKTVTIVSPENKLILPNFPKELSNDKNLEVAVSGLNFPNESECKMTFYKSIDEFSEETTSFKQDEGKCNFNWGLNQFRSNPKGLVELSIGDKTFSEIINLKSGDPANLFVVTPEVRINAQNDLNINLLTSAIVDKQGLLVENGKIKWQYNGKIEELNIEKGFSKLEILANKLESKDIQTSNNTRNLELDLDIKAGISSISKTNNLSIYLGTKDINNKLTEFAPIRASTQIPQENSKIFQFKTEVCKAKLVSNSQISQEIKTHWQGGICYTQIDSNPGQNTINFESSGFNLGKFQYNTTPDPQEIIWCDQSQSDNCLIQVITPINSSVQAVIYDGDKEYKFTSGELENTLKIQQNGLNPLKKYLVKIYYTNTNNEEVIHTREILGQQLNK